MIQRLNKIERPEIELPAQRQKLRRVLLRQYDRPPSFGLAWPVLPVALALAVFLVWVFQPSVFPRTDVALAKEIALQDARVRSLIDRGAIIKETELADNKGYLLVQLAESRPAAAEGSVFFSIREQGSPSSLGPTPAVFLVEVDFRGKKVSDLKEVPNPLSSFSPAEEEVIKAISQQSDVVKKEVPFEAEIKEIQPIRSQLKLIKKGSRVEVKPEKEAVIIYKQDNKEWQGKINLGSSRVEKIEFLGEGDQ